MEISVREAGKQNAHEIADLLAMHVREQARIHPAFVPNPAFSAVDFIEAMMNPMLNKFFAAWDGNKMVAFVRLSILNGDFLVPLDTKVDRLTRSYLKRLPLAILQRLKAQIERIIFRMEKRKNISSIYLPQTRGYLADIYVLEQYRLKGVARMLMDQSLEWFASMGVGKVDLFVLSSNEKGRNFFKSSGFKEYRISTEKELPSED